MTCVAEGQPIQPRRTQAPRAQGRARARARGIVLGAGLAWLLALPGVGPATAAAPEARPDPPPHLVGDPAGLCDVAITAAARETGVPPDLLRALALAESGRARDGHLRPWPWAVNMAGRGYWFETRTKAEAFVVRAHAQGAQNFDIGCLQVNFRWHGAAFASPAQMFDPARNAAYAARFLARLKAEFGSWEAAAGAYHSRTPELAEPYLARVRSYLADAPGGLHMADGATVAQTSGSSPATTPSVPPAGARRPYPLLHTAGQGALGSLVPVATASAPAPLVPLQRDM